MHVHPGGMAGKAPPVHTFSLQSLVFAEDLQQEYGDGVVLQKCVWLLRSLPQW